MAIVRLPSTGDTPRSTGVPASLVAGGEVDSAGFPWAGRDFDHHGTAFAGDDGETPEVWRNAIDRLRAAADPAEIAEAHADALLALSEIRLLVPLVAEAGELGVTPEGRTVEKSQELSIVTVGAPDGRRAMPVFSSVETMQRWNAESRPIPVPGPQVALAAAQEGTDILIIDAGTPEREFGVRRTQLEAVATGNRTLPSWADPSVLVAFKNSIVVDSRIQAVTLQAGDPEARLREAETIVTLELVPGLAQEDLTSVVAELQQRWSADQTIAERVDSLRVMIR